MVSAAHAVAKGSWHARRGQSSGFGTGADWLGGNGSVRGTDHDRFVYTVIGWSVLCTRWEG